MEGEFDRPELLEDKVRHVLKEMQKEKAEGSDDVAEEMLETVGEFGIRKVTKLASCFYDNGEIPKKMRKSVLIAIPKKSGAVDFEKHLTI